MASGLLDGLDLSSVLAVYNPWWRDPRGDWRKSVPPYERPMLAQLLGDLRSVPQILSVTGPRRVGKSTLLRQMVVHLLDRDGVAPSRILYYSLDDPVVFGSPARQAAIVDELVKYLGVPGNPEAPPQFLLLDEIQRLPTWALQLKKIYDLRLPVRFIITGSASTPIVRGSHESLAGRIKARRLLPFSFREYCLYQLREDSSFASTLERAARLRQYLLEGEGGTAIALLRELDAALIRYHSAIEKCTVDYFREGGFPEVWGIPDVVRKQEYLWDSVVKRVLYEDLVELGRARKVPNVARMALYLLSRPGGEINVAGLALESEVDRRVVENSLEFFERADLIRRVRKFRAQPYRSRQTHVKCYAVDIALCNAVLKAWDSASSDHALRGLYAENLVANHLLDWPEAREVTYYREKDREVDFVVNSAAGLLPVEVKYRGALDALAGLGQFMAKLRPRLGLLLTREHTARLEDRILTIPLRQFLLAT